MKRKAWIVVAPLALVALALVLPWRQQSVFGVESRVVSREGSVRMQETTIHRIGFPAFVTRIHELHPDWRVGFQDQTVTFASPDSTRWLWASPGTYNPDSQWTDLGDSENWSTLVSSRPAGLLDWLVPQKHAGTMVVDIPLKYWGRPDKHGFALKLEQMPGWLAKLYESRTGRVGAK